VLLDLIGLWGWCIFLKGPAMEFTALTTEQRARFENDGYLIVRDVLDRATIDRVIAASDRLIGSDLQEGRQRGPDGLYDGFRNCIALDDAYLPLLTHSKVIPLVVQIMGPNLWLFTSHLIYKNPDPEGTPVTKREPGWHRDIAGVDSDLGMAVSPLLDIKVAFYLTDVTEPNSGATLMAPGTNKLKTWMEVPAGRVDPIDVVEPSLKAGDCILFENRTWHAAGANLSGRTRKVVMMGYTYRWMRPADFMVQPPELIAKVEPIGQQFLGGLKDPNGHFIPGGNNKPLMDWWKANGLTGYPKE
jgi:ectoine hydroxylase-related dioxygenase (phytanoyl-CoA dioxygenase family)